MKSDRARLQKIEDWLADDAAISPCPSGCAAVYMAIEEELAPVPRCMGCGAERPNPGHPLKAYARGLPEALRKANS